MRIKNISGPGIIRPIVSSSGMYIFTFHLTSIMDCIYPGNVILIGGNVNAWNFGKVTVYSLETKCLKGFSRVINFICLQANISYRIIALRNKVNSWIFFGGESFLLPMLAIKLYKKKSIIFLLGNMEIETKMKNEFFHRPLALLKLINLRLANHIVLYSPILIQKWNLVKYRDKIIIAHEHFLDFDKFKMRKCVDSRESSIGYIGRLSEEKGIMNFLGSILTIHEKKVKLNFLIVGDGVQRDKINIYIRENGLDNYVELTGWIPHNELPLYLNQLKLLVLPSYSEGLPNIMLEAMACGTPVLATPVGAIPDIIKDGETGFLMENNSPECIAANVIRALEHPDLEGVAERARALVEREFTFEKAVERWRAILEEVGDGGR